MIRALRPIVFLVGVAVMAVELTAVRLLAPHFGASLFVWTNVIAVILLALSLGYGLGGRWADRLPAEGLAKALLRAVFGAGLWILLLPTLLDPVIAAARSLDGGDSVSLPSLAASAVLFGVPVFLAGAVTPLAARVVVRDAAHVGGPLGQLFVVSTLGSLAGTFLPVFVTIPLAGVRATFWILGGALSLAGLWGARRRWIALAAVLALVAGTELRRPPTPSVLWEGDSVYQRLRVLQAFDGSRRLEVNEGGGMQSYYRPDSVWTGYYWDAAAIPPRLHPGGRSYLFLGLGGGTAARVVHDAFPEIDLAGVEIDPAMAAVGRRYFGLDGVPIDVSVVDARVFLGKSGQKFDYIMLDVYRDNRSIPAHLATREFFELVRRSMTPEGILLMNVSTTRKSEQLLSLIRNTLASAFPEVYEAAGPAGARLLFAFSGPPKGLRPPMMRVVADRSQEVATDDRSRVEILAARAAE